MAAPAGLSSARLAARLQRHQGGGGARRDPAHGHPHSLCGAHGEKAGRQAGSLAGRQAGRSHIVLSRHLPTLCPLSPTCFPPTLRYTPHADLILPQVTQIVGAVRDDAILVSCTKGILNDSLETPNEILKRVLPPALHSRLAYLSGPSFAAEVAKQNPTAVTIASESDAVAKHVQVWGQLAGQCRDGMAAVHPQQRFAQLLTQITAALPLKVPIASLPVLPALPALHCPSLEQEMMSTPRFRCYRTHDVTGVELGGALKNVLAIACGISDGLGFGSNGRAALITRGLDEITRLAGGRAGQTADVLCKQRAGPPFTHPRCSRLALPCALQWLPVPAR